MQKSGLKTGCHHAFFSVLVVKRSKILHKLKERYYFCFILGVIFYVFHVKTDLHNNDMKINLCVWLIF